MRIVIQRVRNASVSIDGEIYSEIGAGLLVLVGVATDDTEEDAVRLATKTVSLRIFPDKNGIMNLSVSDVSGIKMDESGISSGYSSFSRRENSSSDESGEILAVSQFTLLASTRKGNRPSYVNAAGHEKAILLYDRYCQECSRLLGKDVKRGKFGADMKVSLVNDGPVTIVMDSKNP